MNLTSSELQRLESDAREFSIRGSLTYLAEAQRCMLDSGDPLAALALLRALWNSGFAARGNEKSALASAGGWLDCRLRREPEVAADRVAFELGWLRRLVLIHGEDRDDRVGDDRSRPPRKASSPPFGDHLELLRDRRRARIATATTPRATTTTPAAPVAATRLPDQFEARVARWETAIEVFRVARKRRKQGKPANDRVVEVVPVAAELQHLGANLVCSLLRTVGMETLIDSDGELPTFWIRTTEISPREGKREPSRITFTPPMP